MSNISTKILTLGCFFTLFLSSSIICEAATYTSDQSGAWDVGTTWVGGTAPTSLTTDDVIIISDGHSVTYHTDLNYLVNKNTIEIYGVLDIDGTIDGKNNVTINIYDGGILDATNLTADTDANMTINVNGSGTISSNLTLGNNATVTVNGSLDIGGNIVVGNSSNLYGTGTVNLTGSCDGGGSDFCSMGPLPVELVYFRATPSGSEVTLEWSTASELNNDFFTIERSGDGLNFDVLTTISGNGTVNSTYDYHYTDQNPALGLSYYRLSQTDYDGTTEQFPMVSVFFKPKNHTVSIYPNPLRGNTIQLRTSGKHKGEAMTLRIINLQGRLIKEQNINADAFGNVDLQIDVDHLLRNKTYIVELISKSDTEFVKVFSE